MKGKFLNIFIFIFLVFSLVGCAGKQGPVGPQGEQGIQGEKGDTGEPGNDGVGVESIKLTSSEGLEDTYTITFTNGDTTTFTVTNGKDGIDGINGEKGEDGHTPVITIKDGYWYIDGVDTGVSAEGVQGLPGEEGPQGKPGEDGLSAYETFIKYYPEYAGNEQEWIYAVATNNVCALFGHKEVTDEAVDATCTETGLTEGSHCEVCGKVFVEQEVIEASHNYVEGICSKCGDNSLTNNIEFTLSDDGESYYVSKYTGNDISLVIPACYNGKPVIKIKEFAFANCETLEKVVLPNSITNIEYWAFHSCTSLKEINIPNSVTHIGYSAFANCKSLTSIVIPESVTTIGKDDAVAFLGCDALESIVVDANNPVYDSRNNCNAIIKTNTNILISGCKNTIIPESVTVIGGGAYSYLNSLTRIDIPYNIIRIDYGAFMECSNLESIFYTGTQKQWQEIDIDNSLGGNSWLLNAILTCTGEEKEEDKFIYESNGDGTSSIVGIANIIVIPSETPTGEVINRISSYSFNNLQNIFIEIPSTIQMIDNYAFNDCDIKEIRFLGTVDEWYNIYKNDGWWNCNTYNFVVICSDGQINY